MARLVSRSGPSHQGSRVRNTSPGAARFFAGRLPPLRPCSPGPATVIVRSTLRNRAARGYARSAAVIWSPNLGVFAVSAWGVLYAFAAWRTRYLDSVSAARLAQIPLSLLFLELSGYGVNAVQRHVNAADVLVRRGVDRDGSR